MILRKLPVRETILVRAALVTLAIGLPSVGSANVIEGGFGVSVLANASVYARNQAGFISSIVSDGPLKAIPSSSHNTSLDNLDSREDQYDLGFNPATNQFEYREIIWASSMYASASASAGPGVLHLNAFAHASLSPGVVLYNDFQGNPRAAPNPLKPWAGGEATAKFQDTMTITSATLAPGTPVDIRSNLIVHHSMNAGPGAYGNISVSLTVGHKFVGAMTNTDPDAPNASAFGLFQEFLTDDGRVTIDYPTGIIHTFVGDQLTFNVSAVIHATVPAGAPNSVNSDIMATTDLGNTIFLGMETVTPGAGFTTLTGFNYATPVPEPTSLALLFGGFLALTARRRSVNRNAQ